MELIQIILIAFVIMIAAYMYLRLRNTLLDIFLILIFAAAAVFFVLFPDTTTTIANYAGVDRGADMIFYLGILFLLFLVLKLYARIRRVEKDFTEFIRNKSIEEAEKNRN